MNFLKFLLIPFTLIYALASVVIEWMYRNGIWGTTSFNLPVIAVGNLNSGGTGKTPMVIFLARMLGQHYKVGIISRGYKRKTFGFRLLSDDDTFETVGDEAIMMQRLLPEAIIAVAENRIIGIPLLLSEHPEIDIILMDDAFQQRGIKPMLNILLTAVHRPFHKDFLLPYGKLRELKKGAKRADMIILSKSSQASDSFTEAFIREQRLPVFTHQSVFSTQLWYGNAYQLLQPNHFLSESDNTTVIAFAGIADQFSMESYLKTQFKEVIFLKFPDHHSYTNTEIEKIFKEYFVCDAKTKILLTTEKDAAKLEHLTALHAENVPFIYVLPMEVSFGTIEQEQRFVEEVMNKMSK